MSGQDVATDAPGGGAQEPVSAARRQGAAAAIRGLYAITPEIADTVDLVALVTAALRGGAAVVQYRAKSADPSLRRQQAAALCSVCRDFRVPLIINDDWRLALALDAAGVHIGADDGDPAAVRAAIGSGKILGVSCYNRFDLAERCAGIADYVAFGSVFASETKPQAVRAGLELFGAARRRGWRTVAIGGIDQGNAGAVIAAGADAVAVISALFGADDVEAAARGLSLLLVRESI